METMEVRTWKDRVLEDGALEMDERHEVLPDSDWVRWLKRRFENENLFVYFHREVGTFVLCVWLGDPCDRICSELKVFHKPPQRIHWNRWSKADLEDLFKPHEQKVWEKQQRTLERRERRQALRNEDREKKEALVKRLRRKGEHGQASHVMRNKYVAHGEGYEQTKDLLKTLTSGRITSIPKPAPKPAPKLIDEV